MLKEEIEDRSNEDKKYFESTELWYLVYTILETASLFHSTGKKVGDIKPLNVFINDSGQTKIASHLTWPNEYHNYEKSLFEK